LGGNEVFAVRRGSLFSGIESVVGMVSSDIRTGRKYNLITAMFSQLLGDFSEHLIENTYNFLIMGLGDSSPQVVKKTFGLSDDEMMAIQRYCVRPGVLFGRFKTRHGVLSQVLYLHASAYERWCFTTQGKDQTLRAALTKYMPFDEVLDLLTDKFQAGRQSRGLRDLL